MAIHLSSPMDSLMVKPIKIQMAIRIRIHLEILKPKAIVKDFLTEIPIATPKEIPTDSRWHLQKSTRSEILMPKEKDLAIQTGIQMGSQILTQTVIRMVIQIQKRMVIQKDSH